jgi:modification methylase
MHKIIFGDARYELDKFDLSSIDLIITSPPYFNRKNYGHKKQIGFNQTFEEYLQDLVLIIEGLEVILSPGRKLCINIGDLYCKTEKESPYHVLSLSSDIIQICKKYTNLIYLGAIIWQKICKTKPSGGVNGRFMGSFPYPPNGIITYDYEYILIFKKDGASKKVCQEIKEKSRLSKKKWEQYFNGHWSIPGDKDKDHPATFPLEIPYRLIQMYSFIGETILDPFLGSGTTTLAAKLLKRNSIGIELNKKKYWPTIQNKIQYNNPGIYEEYKFIMEDYS